MFATCGKSCTNYTSRYLPAFSSTNFLSSFANSISFCPSVGSVFSIMDIPKSISPSPTVFVVLFNAFSSLSTFLRSTVSNSYAFYEFNFENAYAVMNGIINPKAAYKNSAMGIYPPFLKV